MIGSALALTEQGFIGEEPEPVEILDYGRFERRPAAMPIVILNAQQHAACRIAGARHPPDVNRVDDVAEVQVAGRRRRKARDEHDCPLW